jgi:hypothetical protein
MKIRLVVLLSLFVLELSVRSVEILGHSADVGTNTIISEDPSPNPVALDTDSANSNNFGGGDLAASCASQTNYATSALSAASNVRVVVVTNISGSFVYTVETDVITRSESQPSSVPLRLKSFVPAQPTKSQFTNPQNQFRFYRFGRPIKVPPQRVPSSG